MQQTTNEINVTSYTRFHNKFRYTNRKSAFKKVTYTEKWKCKWNGN